MNQRKVRYASRAFWESIYNVPFKWHTYRFFWKRLILPLKLGKIKVCFCKISHKTKSHMRVSSDINVLRAGFTTVFVNPRYQVNLNANRGDIVKYDGADRFISKRDHIFDTHTNPKLDKMLDLIIEEKKLIEEEYVTYLAWKHAKAENRDLTKEIKEAFNAGAIKYAYDRKAFRKQRLISIIQRIERVKRKRERFEYKMYLYKSTLYNNKQNDPRDRKSHGAVKHNHDSSMDSNMSFSDWVISRL